MKPQVAHKPEEATRAQVRPGRRPVLWLFVALAALVVAAIAAGIGPRLARDKALAQAAVEQAGRKPLVVVAPVKPAPARTEMELPGDLQALVESPIFARVDGYLNKRLADVGDRVRAGQVLAEIDTPELDEQIRQARATVLETQGTLKQLEAGIEQARARVTLAGVTLERWKHLTAKGVFARQEADEKQAGFDVAVADQRAAEARLAAVRNTVEANLSNVRRLEQMKTFSRLTAPFDGVVTFRNMSVDSGTLINAGSGGAGHEIFRVAQLNPLRVFVSVPQSSVAWVHTGNPAELRVAELAGQVFPAKVARASDALDVSSRSMLAILEVPNPRGLLHPGMYAQIRFAAPRPIPSLRIPGDALMVGQQGTRVAVVENGKVRIRAVSILRDLGPEVEVSSGVKAGDLVVLNPGDDVKENASVEVRGRPAAQ